MHRKGPALIITADEIRRVVARLPETFRSPTAPVPYPVRQRFIFAWETARRPETISTLRAPDDYHRGGDELVIRDEADKNRFGRTLPLTQRARDALDKVCPGEGLIFGKHDYRGLLRKAALAAGIDAKRSSRITPYDYRHSRLTDLGQTTLQRSVAAKVAARAHP